jgi:hypothetical protein
MGVIGRAELVFEDDHSSADITGENVSGWFAIGADLPLVERSTNAKDCRASNDGSLHAASRRGRFLAGAAAE